ncbi:MAG: protein-glutamate O-methyltransferase CheR [Bacteroidales bacterium]|nr:protein-glutamate O-methyltransferase CheR [Bacteroidales bacterium]
MGDILSAEEINENQNIEIKLFLEALFQKYGYDFRDYSMAHLKRRILHRVTLSELQSISELQHRVLYDSVFLQHILDDFSINVTEMFRDPSFFKTLREEVIPVLKTYPYIKIWDAGCSTGEEVYSLAILLKEEGLYDRSQIYATDFNHRVLQFAKQGTYQKEYFDEYLRNYKKAGGQDDMSAYYTQDEKQVVMNPELRDNIVFADHNLVTDGVFAETNLVICRNVLIYFNKTLQDKVVKLFVDSLHSGGVLCLGSKENLRFSEHFRHFDYVNKGERVYIKKYNK